MTGVSILQLAWMTAGLLIFGLLLLGGLMLTPRGRPIARSLAWSAASLVITLLILFAAFLGGPWTLGPFLLLLAARVGFEAATVRLHSGGLAFAGITTCLTLAAMSLPLAAMILAGLWMVLFGRLIGLPWRTNSRLKPLVDLAVYPILPLALLAYGAMDERLRPVVLVAYILIETFDSYALVFGKLFGRHPAFPILSPRKTVEGLLGGVICLVLTVMIIAVAMNLSAITASALALLVGGLGLAGDLAASRLKRMGGVKDFPVVLQTQGGALDIFDSWIAAGAGIGLLSIFIGLT